jgi:RNA polymerase sigma-70 factor (ECF subfamily)
MTRDATIVRRIPPTADNMPVRCTSESDLGQAMDPSDRVWRERGLQAAVLAGDERAWQTWYEESFHGLLAYVHWRCGGDRHRSEDVVQETWLTAVRRVRSFEPEHGSFSNWLRGIAANILRNQFRSAARWNGRMAALDSEPSARDSAEVELESQDRAERIARTLASLPERYEAVLRAKYLDELSVAEIADAWNETTKAIESLLTRARQAFREECQEKE